MTKMAKEKQEKNLETGIKADASVDVTVEQKEKNAVSETTQTLSASNLIKEFENEQLKKELPEIYVGDTVKVGVKIKEGNKETEQHLDNKKTKAKQIKKIPKSGEEKIQIKIEANTNSKDNATNKSDEAVVIEEKSEIELTDELNNARKKRRRSSASSE